MSETEKPSSDKVNFLEHRCPQCDTVISKEDVQCLMCGTELSPLVLQDKPDVPSKSSPILEKSISATHLDNREKKSFPVFHWLMGVIILVTIGIGVIILRSPVPSVVVAETVIPSSIPPTETGTASATPLVTKTELPAPTVTVTLTPLPTDTPRSPRFHTLESGQTLTLLSIFYRVSVESIALENNLSVDTPIQEGQDLSIPWPTATPPLESILLEINGVSQIANVTDCEIYVIQPDDTAFGIAQSRNVPIEAVIAVNRQTAESIQLLQPGDALCLPKIIYSDTLPPTPGPSPTPGPTLPPAGPALLFPVDNAMIDLAQGGVTLQWTAVKNLTDSEWYMVELSDLDVVDSLPYRGFTRDNSFDVPESWQPQDSDAHLMRWRVSIVEVTDRRSDGGFVYTYGGRSSVDSFFLWRKESN